MNRVSFQQAYSQVRHPARVALAVVQDEQNTFNLITLEWFMRTSIQPPMFAISIGHSRYSYACLQKNRFFNLCFPSTDQVALTILSGSASGRDTDKLADVPWFKGRLAGYPILKNSAAVFECVVASQVRSGDHTIFVGEVKYAWHIPDKQHITVQDMH